MTNTLVSGRAAARGTLLLVLGCAVAAWLLFVAATYIDLIRAGEPVAYTSDAATESVSLVPIVFFAAVAVLGFGALTGLRRMTQLSAAQAEALNESEADADAVGAPLTALARPVRLFSGTTLIVATAISAFTCVGLFFSGFFGGQTSSSPLVQTVNLYLPIVLHTALVVTLVLAGFVFTPRSGPRRAANVSSVAARPVEGDPQRTAALGFAIPVVTAAAALIAGLIAADLTGSATQVWLWTIVLAVIGAGIVAGTRASQHAISQQPDPLHPRGAAVGAKNLNFVLSIVLVAAAGVMSLGYGSSAVGSLRSSPWVSAGVYGDTSTSDDIEWSVSGSDLLAGSTLTARLSPSGTELATNTVDRDGWGNAAGQLEVQSEPGNYSIDVKAVSRDGREVTASTPFTITDRGQLKEDASSDSYTDVPSVLSPVTARWVFADLVPAGLLLIIAAATTVLTVTQRAREYGRPAAK